MLQLNKKDLRGVFLRSIGIIKFPFLDNNLDR